jgi:hypothetical protein
MFANVDNVPDSEGIEGKSPDVSPGNYSPVKVDMKDTLGAFSWAFCISSFRSDGCGLRYYPTGQFQTLPTIGEFIFSRGYDVEGGINLYRQI